MKPVIKDHKIKAKHAQAINVFVQWGSSYRNFLLLVMEKVNRDSGLRHNTFTYLTEAIHKFKLVVSTVVFPMGRDSASFGDKGTEVPSLSRDKGTTGKAQNLAAGKDGPREPVKTWDGTWDRTGF